MSHPPPPPSSSGAPDYMGGSFFHYAPSSSHHYSLQHGSPPPPQRPPSFQQTISFQEPTRPPMHQQQPPPGNGPFPPPSHAPPLSAQAKYDHKPSATGAMLEDNLPVLSQQYDPESGFSAANPNPNFRRKKSLVRPDRERMDPNHRQWYYRNHAAQMEQAGTGQPSRVGYMPSTTGHLPQHGAMPGGAGIDSMVGPGGGLSGLGMLPANNPGGLGVLHPNVPPGGLGRAPPPGAGGGLRRGKSILGRDEDQVESAINVLKRGVSLRRSKSQGDKREVPRDLGDYKQSSIAPGPVGPWMIYCYILTICCPSPFLKCFGIRTPEQQRAWREKLGLIGIIALSMGAVGFLTFGFTQTVCPKPPNRYVAGDIDLGSTTLYGYDYDFNRFYHPQTGIFNASGPANHTAIAYSEPWLTGGRDASLLFQRVDGACSKVITLKAGSTAAKSAAGGPANYFPCYIINGNSSTTFYKGNTPTEMCHSSSVRTDFMGKQSGAGWAQQGQVYFTWDNITNTARNLVVWKGAVLDFDRLQLIDTANVNYPALFDQVKKRNETWAGRDVTASVMRSKQDSVLQCLKQIVQVGFVDSESIGCVASEVELYISLVFIIGVVAIKFLMAVIFGWFLSWRLGTYGKSQTYEQRMKRAAEIEQWSNDIYRPAPAGYRPNARKSRAFLPSTSRFSTVNPLMSNPAKNSSPSRGAAGASGSSASEKGGGNRSPATRVSRLGFSSPRDSPPGSPSLHGARSTASLTGAANNKEWYAGSRRSSVSDSQNGLSVCPFPLNNVVPQPASDYQPFGFPLAQSICLVTAYSESFEGLRTTLDSLATTDYPNSHKVLLVIADGIVKGSGSDISTPDICLSMMKDLVQPAEDVEGHSYVAIADGHKRHNMAKIYAGFYDYDDGTVERSKQQRVPMVLVAKCGTPLEADSAKPGNRGKRDSQVMLMAFMQKVMFDERMTAFEYMFFNSLWRVTGVSPDNYEIVLMVDADTKVFPDSLSRMVACMVEDTEIMGLCGETKIANKTETWVTMIQVFEYYISHHSTKAFEACFGGVTCLPGCFSAYRIKAPKGPNGYWVPILANPDIVEHYSENVVDTLHKKNLLLLGEDRYLTTLMLKTFPKRKMMFVPQAVCKTIVPDTFRVLLSQRRRWINSTVHNLAELVMVNELCGVFCFSMRFVIAMELAGTLVLPAAIAFTFYVAGIAIRNAIDPSYGPIPVIPLVLLAVILGLPGVLIVVTSRKLAYVGWMLVYLLSLPVWNFVLPTYAFWHMDDFSWGATRMVQGEVKGDHGDAEGKFDPSNIVMKRWAEFERERRLKSGTHSRDSTYDIVQRSGSPDRAGSTRYSMISSDTFNSNPSQQDSIFTRPTTGLLHSANTHAPDPTDPTKFARARLDNVPLLELPAPLAPDATNKRTSAAPAAAGSIAVAKNRDLSPATSSVSHTQSSHSVHESYPLSVEYAGDEEKRPMMGSGASSPELERQYPAFQPLAAEVRHGLVSSGQAYPGLQEGSYAQGFSAEPEEEHNPQWAAPPAKAAGAGARPREMPPPTAPNRGFSLVDDGPVATAEGMRPVQRGARRMSSQAAQSPIGRNRNSQMPQ
ncbi:glycosyltransferase family 2 protein [Tilletiaria anomala UBC 951]|uniref:chitin synthase n=1 Tax=Tilletiaria anomala (strain ATCC 24038 / CBS 436.72 / UBC 951) TaxID=1037660 RepID=A0A066VV27_TILAU|nr:glycosyltransferase family 2 protein [Tilletiaria anomala UBC 951]KDN45587.1 glycosyltransferase family 2 protein [Tilletiaria anomala UBC 951]